MVIRSEGLGKLAKSLVEAQKAMGKAHKSAENPFFKSKYADLEAVLDTVLCPLNDNGIALVQLTGEEGNKATVTTMLVHESGEFLGKEAGLPLQKFDGHALGSAYTYLRRYGASAAVGLVQSDDDGNAATQAADISDTPAHKVQVIGGKFDGFTLGEIATKAGLAGMGYLYWMASQKNKDPMMAAKAQEIWEAHKQPYTDDEVNDLLADADTVDDLNGLYRLLTDEQQASFKDQFTAARADLETPTQRTAATARA